MFNVPPGSSTFVWRGWANYRSYYLILYIVLRSSSTKYKRDGGRWKIDYGVGIHM